jgi:hypothetical protein
VAIHWQFELITILLLVAFGLVVHVPEIAHHRPCSVFIQIAPKMKTITILHFLWSKGHQSLILLCAICQTKTFNWLAYRNIWSLVMFYVFTTCAVFSIIPIWHELNQLYWTAAQSLTPCVCNPHTPAHPLDNCPEIKIIYMYIYHALQKYQNNCICISWC